MTHSKPLSMADGMNEDDASQAKRPNPDTVNDFVVIGGQNLPNHSQSLKGRAKFIAFGRNDLPAIRTKQHAYRVAAYLLQMAEIQDLPNEEGAHTFEEVREAIRQQ